MSDGSSKGGGNDQDKGQDSSKKTKDEQPKESKKLDLSYAMLREPNEMDWEDLVEEYTINKKDKEWIVIDQKLNYSTTMYLQLFLYPLSVLATNRAINCVISRRPKNRMFYDLADTFRLGGHLALYAGAIPYFVLTNLAVQSRTVEWEEVSVGKKPVREVSKSQNILSRIFGDYRWQKKEGDDIEDERGFRFYPPLVCTDFEKGESTFPRRMTTTHKTDTWTTFAVLGFINILTVRMQVIDFPFRNKLFKTFHDMIMKDGIKSLYLGLVPILAGQYIFSHCLDYSTAYKKFIINYWAGADFEKRKEVRQKYFIKYFWAISFAIGCLVSYPFLITGMQVIYARFNTNPVFKKNFTNSIKTMYSIGFYQGITGYYKGFVPFVLFEAAAFKDTLKELQRIS